MTPPRKVLVLFCGAGGACKGLHDAWPEANIIGIDIVPQPNYPYRFVQGDAMTIPIPVPCSMLDYNCGEEHGPDGCTSATAWVPEFIWASPVCKGHTQLNHSFKGHIPDYPVLIPTLRKRLAATGIPYCIENVIGAPLPSAIRLCGTTFGLSANVPGRGVVDLHRHRLFETSWPMLSHPCQHHRGRMVVGFYGDHARLRRRSADGGDVTGTAEKMRLVREAMGIDWMTWSEANQAIPPAYSEYIARQFMAASEAA